MSFIIILAITALDQFSKSLVLEHLKDSASIPLWEGVFHLTYAENTGAAFSIFTDMQLFLKIITSVFSVVLLIYLILLTNKEGKLTIKSLSLALIIGGALGNLIDRFRFNFVVDFFDFRLINFAIFNVADIFIVSGSILLIIVLLLEPSDAA